MKYAIPGTRMVGDRAIPTSMLDCTGSYVPLSTFPISHCTGRIRCGERIKKIRSRGAYVPTSAAVFDEPRHVWLKPQKLRLFRGRSTPVIPEPHRTRGECVAKHSRLH